MAEVISVSALNQYVKTLLDANDILFDLALRGEIANFVQNARSGHCYFSLRDAAASVKAVMFRSDARRLGFRPEEGMKVVVRCRATLYERDGAFQVYVNEMFPDGIGAAQLVDGEHGLPPQPPARVFLSVNPGGQLCLNGRTVWNFEKSKLGMDLQTLLSMCRRFLASGTEAISPCVFLRDQDLEPARFQAALERLLRLAGRLYQELGIGVQSVLICGGLGASYRPSEQAPDLQAVSDFVQEKYEEILAPAGLCPDLLLAAGRILAAKAGVLVTRVLAVKPQQKPVVVLDADCAQFLREIAFGATHRLMAPLVPESRQKRMVRVAGSLCDLRDHFPGTCVLPDLKLGECVLICDAGADGRSFASNYGGSPGCAEFLLEQGGEVRCIRRRQTIDELLAAFDAE